MDWVSRFALGSERFIPTTTPPPKHTHTQLFGHVFILSAWHTNYGFTVNQRVSLRQRGYSCRLPPSAGVTEVAIDSEKLENVEFLEGQPQTTRLQAGKKTKPHLPVHRRHLMTRSIMNSQGTMGQTTGQNETLETNHLETDPSRCLDNDLK